MSAQTHSIVVPILFDPYHHYNSLWIIIITIQSPLQYSKSHFFFRFYTKHIIPSKSSITINICHQKWYVIPGITLPLNHHLMRIAINFTSHPIPGHHQQVQLLHRQRGDLLRDLAAATEDLRSLPVVSGTQKGPHFTTFLEMQEFFYIAFDHVL